MPRVTAALFVFLMYDFIEREIIYLWYYLDILCRQIVPFYIIGTLLGSAISVFAKDRIHALLVKSKLKKFGNMQKITSLKQHTQRMRNRINIVNKALPHQNNCR